MIITGSMFVHDGDYAFSGGYRRDDVDYSILTKLDTLGETVWENVWDARHSWWRITETPDSGIACFGRARNSFMIKKFNIGGDIEYTWELDYEGRPSFDEFISDGEGGYVAAGYHWVHQEARYDFLLLKVSTEGELEWLNVYDDRPRDQNCRAVTAVSEGGFMMVGNTRENNVGNEVNVIRTDEGGEVIWHEHYGTEMIDIPANEGGYDIIETDDGNFVIVGQTLAQPSDGTGFNVLLLKINLDGDLIWMEVINMGHHEKGRSIEKTMDSGFVISGYSVVEDEGTFPFLLKTDDNGNRVWFTLQEEVRVSDNVLHHYNALIHEDRTFSLVCGSLIQGGDTPGFLQKFGRDPHGVADGNIGLLPSWTGLESAYPNPFNGITTFVFTVGSPADVEIDIFNALGRRQTELVRRSYPVGQHRLSWDAGGLPSGDYFARMVSGGRVSTRRVSLVK